MYRLFTLPLLARFATLLTLVFAATLPGCAITSVAPDRVAAGATTPIQGAGENWTDEALAAMSLEEKAGQMIMVRAYGQHRHPDSWEYRSLLASVSEQRVGGIVLFDSDLESIPRLVETLQKNARIPLLVAADLEAGLGFRVRRGASELPSTMAIGATRSHEAARFAGELTGREARAVGINWVLAPVVDVNNNPANPVINTRSFGEDPELVAEMAVAFLEGARSTGVLTTAKHFPGHGDTSEDSHLVLPVLDADRARLERVELAPFRAAIAAGVDSVMTGHLSVPALDPTGAPASLSKPMTEGLLRDELGFDGLIATDAMEMKGAGVLWAGGAVVEAIRAGADVVLLPADTRVAIQSIVRAVRKGQLDESRLDESVRRILQAKRKLGLNRDRETEWSHEHGPWTEIARPADGERIRAIAAAAITVVRNHGNLLPLHADRPLREPLQLLHVVLKDTDWRGSTHGVAAAALRRRVADTVTREGNPTIETSEIDEIVAAAASATHVVVSAYVRRGAGQPPAAREPQPPAAPVPGAGAEPELAPMIGLEDPPVAARAEPTASGPPGGFSPAQVELLTRLQGVSSPILLSFGSPYLLSQVPEIPVYVSAYGADAVTQHAAIAALFGEASVRGKLPVSLPEVAGFGRGLDLAPYAMTLPLTAPEAVGFRTGATGLTHEVARVIEDFIAQRAFPGAAVAVGHKGKLALLEGYGRLSYAFDAPAVTAETLYDLASLTKVIVTTTVAMMMVDQERLDLDAPVESFLPLFAGPGKEKVTVRHLLTHSSGIDWWAPLYKEVKGKAAYLERIQSMPLVNEPGTKTVYSDLGLILLGEILERVAGEPLDAYVARRVFKPLGMTDTLYNPGPELLDRIAPTEEDPAWRGRLVHGEVHDENAFALGGVAPHAGLFGTASDLARFVQMILDGGVFEHHRIVSRATLAEFTRLAGLPDSTRALGWDTKSPEGSSAGSMFSPSSFGHTGFTGTSIWIDPERELFLILLTNRVHPTRDNQLIRKARPAVADAVVGALIGEPAVESDSADTEPSAASPPSEAAGVER